MRSQRNNIPQALLAILGVIITLVAGTFALQAVAGMSAGMAEFPINYFSAQNWITDNRSPYDPANGQELEILIRTRDGPDSGQSSVQFRYLPLTVLFILPFTLLPLPQAEALWMTISILCLVVAGVLMVRMQKNPPALPIVSAAALFCSINLFSVMSLLDANAIPLIFLFIILTLFFLLHSRDGLAGFLGTLIMLDLQLGIFISLFILIWAVHHKRKGYVRGFWAALLFELIISLILIPSWPAGFLRTILVDSLQNEIYASALSLLIGSGFPNGTVAILIIHVALLLVMGIIWIAYPSRDETFLIWVVSITMILVSMMVFPVRPGHQVFCVPSLILILYQWLTRWKEHGHHFFWVAGIILILLPWLIGWLAGPPINEYFKELFYALVGMAGLWWIRWWMVRPVY